MMENFEPIETDDGFPGLKCKRCGRETFHPKDVKNPWCMTCDEDKVYKNASLKDALHGCETFQELSDKVKENTLIRKEQCKTHGLADHSYCSLSNVSFCIECLKERRFPKPEYIKK